MNIQIFNFNEAEIQVLLDDNNEPWWIATDVCYLLGLSNTTEALRAIPDKNKLTSEILRAGQNRAVNLINEPGLYRLIARSNKPLALMFQDWVFEEVVPSLRKTGFYGIKELSKDERLEQLAQGTLELLQIKQQLETKIEQDKPKIKLHDAIMDTNDTLSIKEMAKLLGTGQNRLFAWLRAEGYLMSNNLPYQPYLDRGYFIPKEMPLHKGDKSEIYLQTRVTTKGQVWLSNKFN